VKQPRGLTRHCRAPGSRSGRADAPRWTGESGHEVSSAPSWGSRGSARLGGERPGLADHGSRRTVRFPPGP
jgi:hypothetical protein